MYTAEETKKKGWNTVTENSQKAPKVKKKKKKAEWQNEKAQHINGIRQNKEKKQRPSEP